jgi:hypothetical protein
VPSSRVRSSLRPERLAVVADFAVSPVHGPSGRCTAISSIARRELDGREQTHCVESKLPHFHRSVAMFIVVFPQKAGIYCPTRPKKRSKRAEVARARTGTVHFTSPSPPSFVRSCEIVVSICPAPPFWCLMRPGSDSSRSTVPSPIVVPSKRKASETFEQSTRYIPSLPIRSDTGSAVDQNCSPDSLASSPQRAATLEGENTSSATRTGRACLACRKLKVSPDFPGLRLQTDSIFLFFLLQTKCEGADRPPCRRCKLAGNECILVESRRGKRPPPRCASIAAELTTTYSRLHYAPAPDHKTTTTAISRNRWPRCCEPSSLAVSLTKPPYAA